jgi:hypothetical protein
LLKPVASRGWVCVFYVVPVLAILAAALFVLSPARHRNAVGSASAASPAAQPGTATPDARARIQASYAALPLAFEQNQGQTDGQVKYTARANGYTLFLTANDAVFSLRSRTGDAETSSIRRASALRAKTPRGQSNQKESTAVVRMQLVGGNSLAKVSANDQLPGKTNYFVGNDPSKWRSNVASYARVSYEDVYPGVNLAFHGAQRQLEFDFMVAPGANPAPIGFHFTGAQRVNTDDSGNLILSSAAGDVLLHKPVAYQEQNGARHNVDARFVLKANNKVSFELGNYDRSRELVIDPSVSYEYSTYLGGSGDDEGFGIAFDSSGGAYVTGQTASQNFPGTSGGFMGTAQVFVTKISSAGSSLVYSTYIGGTGANGDSGNAIAVNSSGDAFVAGGTTSTDFPTTGGVFQTVLHGTSGNAFVLKLNSTGAITYSTYLGGTGDDTALGIALASDGSGDVYVVGKASSHDFPTQNPLQAYLSGSSGSGFVTKLNASGTAPLLYSTYLGGSGVGDGDLASAVAVDSSNNTYVTGQTFNSSFHTTLGAFQTTCGSCTNGNSNAFVTVLNPAGNDYVYSTFLGGSALDVGDGIAVDSADSAYVTGATESTNFPTTSGAWQTAYGTNTDAFITKLNPAGSALVYSTYLGGSGFDTGISIAVDGTNNAYVTGQTGSSNFPTAGPTQSALNGGNGTTSPDAFVSEINPAGSQLVFSTYLGGSADEDDGSSGAIAVDSAGDTVYVTGDTDSLNFPTTLPFQAANGGGTDAFVLKYTQGPSFTISASTPAAVSPGSSGSSTVTLTAEHGYSSAVNLSCSVSGSGSPAPACSASSFSPDSVTPTSAGATSTLTITTTGTSGAMVAPRKFFYAMWLPIAGLSLMGMSFSSTRSRRKKLLGFLMIGMVMAALFVMPACGGSSNSSGGGGGGGGTPAGSYTVTITGTGTDANALTATTQVTLTVN